MEERRMKPFVSYVGSKSKLINEIDDLLPKQFTRFFEPFLGGGSVLFYVGSTRPDVKQFYVNDLEPKLINLYKTVRNHSEHLIYILTCLNTKRNKSKKTFLKCIEEYNHGKLPMIEGTALYYYLLKLSFNSNLKYDDDGNVRPTYSASHANSNIFQHDNLINVSEFLRNSVKLYNESYITFIKRFTLGKNDFVFLDPPYNVELVKQYYTNDFDDKDYQRLLELCNYIDSQGAKLMVTLDDHPLHRRLFKDFKIRKIQRHSYISSGKNIDYELFITNY